MRWDDILSDPTFQEQPEDVKLEVARNWFNATVVADPTFREQPPEVQDQVLSNFLDTVRGSGVPAGSSDRGLEGMNVPGAPAVEARGEESRAVRLIPVGDGSAGQMMGAPQARVSEEVAEPKQQAGGFWEYITRPFKAQTYEAAKYLNLGLEGFTRRLADIGEYVGKRFGVPRSRLFDAIADTYRQNADYWEKRAREVGPNVIDEIVGAAVGGAVPGVTEFAMGVPYAALEGAAEAEKQGRSEVAGALTGGVKRALLGKIFEAAGVLKQPYGAAATGAAFAAQTAAEGGSPSDIAQSAGIGLLYGGLSRGGEVGPREVIESFKRPAGKAIEELGEETFQQGDQKLRDIEKEVIGRDKEDIKGLRGEGRELGQEAGRPLQDKEAGREEAETGGVFQKEEEIIKTPGYEGPERRKNLLFRKRVEEMSPDERAYVLLHDELTGLKNKRAFEEEGPAPYTVAIDLDGLKYVNDTYGHEAGDELLKGLARAIKKAGLDRNIYRFHGDEFYGKFTTEEGARGLMERLQSVAKDTIMKVKDPETGKELILKGVIFSHGIGRDLTEADRALYESKRERQRKGYRVRGLLPQGMDIISEGARTGEAREEVSGEGLSQGRRTRELDKKHLEFIKSRIEQGEAGRRTSDPQTGQPIIYPSTFPDWFKNKGYKKKDVLSIVDKALARKPLTERQQAILDDLVESSREEFQEASRQDLAEVIDKNRLKEGDRIKIGDEWYEIRGVDEDGNVVLKDGRTIRVDPFEEIKEPVVDIKKKPAGEGVLEPPEQEVRKGRASQEDIFGTGFGLEEDVLRQPLRAEETPETELERAAEEARQKKIEQEMQKRQVSIPATEADVGGYAGGYERFLDERIRSGKMEPIKEHQRKKLIEAFRDFPFGKTILTKQGEEIHFRPTKGQTKEEYIHHFLTKYSALHGRDYYSEKYLNLVKEIPGTIKNYDDRILGLVGDKERIYYVRELPGSSKRPHHVIVVATDSDGNFVGWTHFDAKEGYKKNLLLAEKEAIKKYGLVDKAGNRVDLSYDEYRKESRRSLLYLGSNAQKGHQRSQEPPSPSNLNISQKGRDVKKGSGREADTGGYQEGKGISAIELPELVELAVRINEGKYPRIRRKLRAAGGQALGQFRSNALKGSISLRADIFKGELIGSEMAKSKDDFEGFKKDMFEHSGLKEDEIAFGIEYDPKRKRYIFMAYRKDPTLSAKVLAHEIGHLVDWLPNKDLKRGNILGRIASLKKYMRTMLEEMPDSPNEILIPQERKKIRNRLQREVAREMGGDIDRVIKDKEFRQRVLDEARKRYRKEIQRIIKERKLYTRQEIMEELKALTQAWKPFDETIDDGFTKYRYSSKELYADALSVLLNDPELLKKTAPKFTKAFFAYLERKPEVKEVYEEIQKRLKDQGAVTEARLEREREMFARGEEALRKREERPEIRFKERLKRDLIDINEAIIRKVKEAKRTGKEISEEDNPIFWLEEAAHKGTYIKEYLRDVYSRVVKRLEEAGIETEDLASYLLHQRVVNERTEIANPLGYTPETSQRMLEEMRQRLGEEKFREIEKAAEEFREIRKETVIRELQEAEIFSDELMKKIEDNEHYATFSVVDYLAEKLGKGSGIGSYIFKQYGTLSEIANPFTATVMKDIALIRAVNQKMAAKKTVEFLMEHFPGEIKKADYAWNGKAQVPVEPDDPNLGMIRFLHKGKVEAYYVDKYIAESFIRNPSETGLVTEVLRKTNVLWKELFVNRNPGFWLFNAWRDYRRAAINLPGASVIKLLPEYVKAIRPAFKEALGVPEEITREMNRKKMLISVEDVKGLNKEDKALERLLARYHLRQRRWENRVTRPFQKLWQYWGDVGQAIEIIPKIAGYRYLKKHTTLGEKEIGHIVRTQVGSPDFLRRGKGYGWYNNLFLFSNAMKEGWRGDWEVIRQRPAEYFYKTAKYTLLPKMLMYAVALGLLGEGLKRQMEKASEFDKTNYIVVPVGETETGKAVYIRMPLDETGRFLGGVLWKALTLKREKDIANLLDYMAGQAPTLTPTVGIAVDVLQYLMGKNPYNWFRGKYAVPERIFEAGGWRSHKEFLKYLAKQAGSGIVYKFPEDIETIKTRLEKVLDAPIASNIVGRFVKVSRSGEKQALKDVAEEARQKELRRQLEVKDRIVELINQYSEQGKRVPAGEAVKLYHRMVRDGLIRPDRMRLSQFRRLFNKYQVRVNDIPYIEAMAEATTTAEKVALLREYQKRLTRKEYMDILRILYMQGFISESTLEDLVTTGRR